MAKAVNAKYREIVKLFNSLIGSKGAWEVWNDVIQMVACTISNAGDCGNRKDKREKLYKDTIKKYTDEEVKIIFSIFTSIINRLEENPDQDLLGDLYMNLDFGSAALGQFFTPYSVSVAMAQCVIDIDEIKNKIEEKGYIKINEPCCGGGENVIAACNVLRDAGINYQTDCLFVCQDLSYVTALMCYIQMSLIGAAAVIKIGDTLLNPAIENQTVLELDDSVWFTPMYQNDLWHIRREARLLDEMFNGVLNYERNT